MSNLTALANSVSTHEALNNKFYDIWMCQKLPIEKIAVFARNYWEFAYRFPEALAVLFLNVNNVIARAEYAKTLYSEMGYGDPKRVHSLLFEEFCKDLSRNLGKEDYLSIENLKKNYCLLPETQSFIDGQKKLYSQEHSIAVGAQLALEWQAYTMVRKLYEGARNYMSVWPHQDAFHESCEFFYVHIGTAEKEHKQESIIAASKIIEEGGSFEDLLLGFYQHLDLIASFWGSIATQIAHTS